jgi:LysM domain
MAIAAFPEIAPGQSPTGEVPELPWPRPALRLIEGIADVAKPFDHPPSELVGLDLATVTSIGDDVDARAWDWAFMDQAELSDGDDAPSSLDGAERLAFVEPSAHRIPVMANPARSVVMHRAHRRTSQVRRRRLALGLLCGALLVLLALPISALGGRTVARSSSAITSATPQAYTVQPGDTLWTVAQRVDPGGDPRVLVAQLAAQTGSTTLIPGERLALPATGS